MTCPEFMDNIRYSTKEGIFIDADYLSDMYWRIVQVLHVPAAHFWHALTLHRAQEEIKKEEAAKFPFANKKGYLELKLGPFYARRWIVLSDGNLIVCKSATNVRAVRRCTFC